MDMSRAYMQQTVGELEDRGFRVEQLAPRSYGEFDATAWRLETEGVGLELETVEGEPERYYLAIENYFGLSVLPCRLDSWKYFPDRIEFKFATDPEVVSGLSITLRFADIPGLKLPTSK
ncbi:MAG: hypothetical protein AAFY60_16165 [Myxococcota bacterium]